MMSIEAMTDLRISFRHQSLGVTCMFFGYYIYTFKDIPYVEQCTKKNPKKSPRAQRQ